MKKPSSRWIALAAFFAALGMVSSAHAVWTFNQAGVTNLTGSASGDPMLSLTGVYAGNNTLTGVVGGNWSSGTLVWYSGKGQGMSSDGTTVPNDALDNVGNTEAVVLNFGSSVVLTGIGLGYTSNGVLDTKGDLIKDGNTEVDLSVFRWTGVVGPTPAGSPPQVGQDAATMAGWELVGNYGDMTKDTSNPYNLVNATGKGSSWWLISAYNTGFSQTAVETRGTLDTGGDYFKLYAVAGSKCTTGDCGGKTPEPGSMALVLTGLIGAVGVQRRRSLTQRVPN